jgi:hypothetical protein
MPATAMLSLRKKHSTGLYLSSWSRTRAATHRVQPQKLLFDHYPRKKSKRTCWMIEAKPSVRYAWILLSSETK